MRCKIRQWTEWIFETYKGSDGRRDVLWQTDVLQLRLNPFPVTFFRTRDLWLLIFFQHLAVYFLPVSFLRVPSIYSWFPSFPVRLALWLSVVGMLIKEHFIALFGLTILGDHCVVLCCPSWAVPPRMATTSFIHVPLHLHPHPLHSQPLHPISIHSTPLQSSTQRASTTLNPSLSLLSQPKS